MATKTQKIRNKIYLMQGKRNKWRVVAPNEEDSIDFSFDILGKARRRDSITVLRDMTKDYIEGADAGRYDRETLFEALCGTKTGQLSEIVSKQKPIRFDVIDVSAFLKSGAIKPAQPETLKESSDLNGLRNDVSSLVRKVDRLVEETHRLCDRIARLT